MLNNEQINTLRYTRAALADLEMEFSTMLQEVSRMKRILYLAQSDGQPLTMEKAEECKRLADQLGQTRERLADAIEQLRTCYTRFYF